MSRRVSVAFRAKRPMNYEMFRPLHAWMRRDDTFDVTLYGKAGGRSDTSVLAAALPARIRPNWTCKFASPDVLISSDFLLATKRAKVSVQIFHGVSIKNYFLSKRIHDYDIVFATGPYMIRRYVERGFFDDGDPKLRHVGLPKTDRLTDGTLDRAATLESWGLDPAVPTVLYAPSWGGESSLDKMGEAILEALAARSRAEGDGALNVVVKLHDNAFDERYARRDWRAFLDGLVGPRFAAPATADVVPAMHAADLMITDISSVAFEYLQCDRPIIFMTFDEQLARWDGQADLETWGRSIGTECSSAEQLVETVERELANPERVGPVRRDACADIYFNVGSSARAGMRELYGHLDLPVPTDLGTTADV